MHLREISRNATIQAGSFNADSRGRWYLNVTVEIPLSDACHDGPPIGIDLGLKVLVALSTGEKIVAPRLLRASEIRLATAQRARKTKRVRAIHRKVTNRRKDFLHKLSRRLTTEFGTIIVGDVSAAKLARSRMAKSVFDASWANLKGMLSYKAITRGGIFLEVCEADTTQTCSECGAKPASRPRGIAGLRMREWVCDDCAAVHDRDVNAARNILRCGLAALAEGTSLQAGNSGLQAEE
jgi:IS605 OrfB family transposase